MPEGAELLALAGNWVDPVIYFTAFSVFAALGLTVRAYLGKRVTPLVWVLFPILSYLVSIFARLQGHKEATEAMSRVYPDQVHEMLGSAVAIASLVEFVGASALLTGFALCAGLALLASFIAKPHAEEGSSPAPVLRWIALALIALAATMPWRSAILEGFYLLHNAFASSAPDLLVAKVTSAHQTLENASILSFLAIGGVLTAAIALYQAGSKSGQGAAAFAAPCLVVIGAASTVYALSLIHI